MAIVPTHASVNVVVDLAGDMAAVLPTAATQLGISDWLRAGDGVPADALARLEVEVTPGLRMIPRGQGPLDAERSPTLAALLCADPRTVVADCGTNPSGAARVVAQSAERSVAVLRPCFLSLRRMADSPLRPTEIVLIDEPGRSLSATDVSRTCGVPVVATLPFDPAIARVVDAGLLCSRLPKRLKRGLQRGF